MNTCQSCNRECREVYQRVGDLLFVCADCLPAKQVAHYPGWKERLAERARKAEQARRNFQLTPQGGSI